MIFTIIKLFGQVWPRLLIFTADSCADAEEAYLDFSLDNLQGKNVQAGHAETPLSYEGMYEWTGH